jgi:uncharacterized protein
MKPAQEYPISFTSQGFCLKGTLHLPDCHNPPVVVGCHGLMADSSSPKQAALAHMCTASQIAYLRFDHRGCGNSQGAFQKDTSFAGRCQDLRCALDFLDGQNRLGSRRGLFGSSFGGAVCLKVAAERRIDAIVTYAAPISSQLISRPGLAKSSAGQILQMDDAGTKLTFDLAGDLALVNHILVLHGDADEIVVYENARIIHDQAGEPKELITQTGGDHRMSDAGHQKEFIHSAQRWFMRYLLKNGYAAKPVRPS